MAKPEILKCTKCSAVLTSSQIVWLELNFETGIFSREAGPLDKSQGWFPFGRNCARRLISEQNKGSNS